jgi:hypothetical protein
MPDKMPERNRSEVSSSFQTINKMGLDAARSFSQPTSISEPVGAEAQLRAAREFPQPEAKGYIPDIRMQLPPDAENLDINALLRALSGRAATSGLEKFSRDLQTFFGEKKVRDKIENEVKDFQGNTTG